MNDEVGHGGHSRSNDETRCVWSLDFLDFEIRWQGERERVIEVTRLNPFRY